MLFWVQEKRQLGISTAVLEYEYLKINDLFNIISEKPELIIFSL